MSYSSKHDDHVANGPGHISYDVSYLSSGLGRLMIKECDQCGYLIPLCQHEKNTWNEAGTRLTCDLCGEDGT